MRLKLWIIPLYTFSLVLFIKFHLVHPPDVFAALILVCGLRYKKVISLLCRPVFILFYFVIQVNLVIQIFALSPKPFWSYHLARLIIYLGAAYYLGLALESADRKFVFWYGVWSFLAVLGTVTAVFFPQHFPQFFLDLRVESFWGNDRKIYEHQLSFRNSGIYASYAEAGMVMAVGYLLALGQLKENYFRLRMLFFVSLLVLCVIGVFLTGFRTALVGILVGTFTMYCFWSLKAKMHRQATMLFFCIGLSGVLYELFVTLAFFEFSGQENLQERFFFMSHVWKLLVSGEINSSLAATFSQIVFPVSSLIWLVGNSSQPWFVGGVESDVGYIQLLWGLGLLGLTSVTLLYTWMVVCSFQIYKKHGNGFSISILAILIVYFMINIKGQFFIGIRAGDLAVVSFGFFLGASHRMASVSSKLC